MILYTMMPLELVFPPSEEAGTQVLISHNGIPLIAERTENQEYKVVRVLSTDPNHFLNPGCAPGSTISL